MSEAAMDTKALFEFIHFWNVLHKTSAAVAISSPYNLKKIGALSNPKNGKKSFDGATKPFLPFLGFVRAPIFFKCGDNDSTAQGFLQSSRFFEAELYIHLLRRRSVEFLRQIPMTLLSLGMQRWRSKTVSPSLFHRSKTITDPRLTVVKRLPIRPVIGSTGYRYDRLPFHYD